MYMYRVFQFKIDRDATTVTVYLSFRTGNILTILEWSKRREHVDYRIQWYDQDCRTLNTAGKRLQLDLL